MQFLFHTVLTFDATPVYYSIFREKDRYFAQVLDNPFRVANATNFWLEHSEGEWKSSEDMPLSILEQLGEEIEQFINKSSQDFGMGLHFE